MRDLSEDIRPPVPISFINYGKLQPMTRRTYFKSSNLKQALLLLLSEAQKFLAELIQFQSLTTTSKVDTQAFSAKKVDWSLFCEPVQESIKYSLREFNNNLTLFQKLDTQVADLTRRFNEKNYPSFINVSISIPKFHFDPTMSQEDRGSFMEDQRQNIHVIRGESNSIASALRENVNRVAASTTAIKQQLIGHRADFLIRQLQTEYACGESRKRYTGEKDTKLLLERDLKLPKMIKDQLLQLFKFCNSALAHPCWQWIAQPAMSVGFYRLGHTIYQQIWSHFQVF